MNSFIERLFHPPISLGRTQDFPLTSIPLLLWLPSSARRRSCGLMTILCGSDVAGYYPQIIILTQQDRKPNWRIHPNPINNPHLIHSKRTRTLIIADFWLWESDHWFFIWWILLVQLLYTRSKSFQSELGSTCLNTTCQHVNIRKHVHMQCSNLNHLIAVEWLSPLWKSFYSALIPILLPCYSGSVTSRTGYR